MNITKFSVILIGVLALCACSTSQTSSEADAASHSLAKAGEQPETAGKPKMVCKRMVPTGSRLGKKVCATQEKWDTMARESAETLRSQTRRAVLGNPDS